MRDLKCLWAHDSFQLESDSWVIASDRKQFVGLVCTWHRDHEEFYTFICVHLEYRKDGIGTMLLRLAEQHAHELMYQASSCARVSMRGIVSGKNAQVRSLFEREGYLAIREFWHVALELVEASGEGISHPGKFAVDVDVEDGQLVGISPLFDHEGLYSIRQFVIYEKELRPSDEEVDCVNDSAKTLAITQV